MKRKLSIVLLILISLPLSRTALAYGEGFFSTSSQEKTIITVQNEQETTPDTFFQEKAGYFKDLTSRGAGWLGNRVLANIRPWLEERKEGIKIGLEQEKREAQADFKGGVKNFFKNIFKSFINIFK